MNTYFSIDNKIIKYLGGFISIFILFVVTIYIIVLSWSISCSDSDNIVVIPKGASVERVINIIKDNKCLTGMDSSVLKLSLYLTFRNGKIYPGRYTFNGITSIGNLINLITKQSGVRKKVTLLEGWTVEEIADELNDKLQIDTYKFISLCRDFNFVNSLNINAPSIEGFLFPDTYIFLSSYTEKQIITLMVNQFFLKYKKHISGFKNKNLPSMRHVVTMASIIQGEAMFDDEMSTISSVYHNRLKRKMLLQADPTIQYIVPGKNIRLYNKHLKLDSPYNTYMYKGLPPGPINNPGLAALKAAVKPEVTNYLFFVADGEGRHIFTRNNNDHNKAKKILQKKRREMRRNRK